MAKTVRATITRALAERHRELARLYDRRAVSEELRATMAAYATKLGEVEDELGRLDAQISAQLEELEATGKEAQGVQLRP